MLYYFEGDIMINNLNLNKFINSSYLVQPIIPIYKPVFHNNDKKDKNEQLYKEIELQKKKRKYPKYI